MSSLKTKVDANEVLEFLKGFFEKEISAVSFIKGGEMSQAFSFKNAGNNYVIRINSKKYSYDKDRYAYKHFSSNLIPIPKIFEIGKFNRTLFFAISEKATGKNLEHFDHEVQERLEPQLVSVLDAIHCTKIPDGSKYGHWNADGVATFTSWKDFILNYKDEVYSNWENLYKKTFLEKDVIKQIFKNIQNLSGFLPEGKFLVHGDYGFSNVISNGEKITGVLDWGESIYGDFLYDVAWLQFWHDKISYEQVFKKHYLEKNIEVPNYFERLLCYQLRLGAGSIGFFALSGQKDSYIWTKNKLISLLKSM